jgi:hypothetical protein
MTSKFFGKVNENFECPENPNISEDFLGVEVSWK